VCVWIVCGWVLVLDGLWAYTLQWWRFLFECASWRYINNVVQSFFICCSSISTSLWIGKILQFFLLDFCYYIFFVVISSWFLFPLMIWTGQFCLAFTQPRFQAKNWYDPRRYEDEGRQRPKVNTDMEWFKISYSKYASSSLLDSHVHWQCGGRKKIHSSNGASYLPTGIRWVKFGPFLFSYPLEWEIFLAGQLVLTS